MDYETIGEIKYFLSDIDEQRISGFDKKAEFKRLEGFIVRSKYSFMIADKQLHLLNEIGFERNDVAPTPITEKFINEYSSTHSFDFSYIRKRKNKTIELFFCNTGLMTEEGVEFFFLSMKTVQDSLEAMGNGKVNFLHAYDNMYDAEPTLMFKRVDGFIEKTLIDPSHSYLYSKIKKYYPLPNTDTSFYLLSANFNIHNKATSLHYSVMGQSVSYSKLKKLIPDGDFDMDSLAKGKTTLYGGYADLIKILCY